MKSISQGLNPDAFDASKMAEIEVELEDRTLTIDDGTLRRVQAVWRGAVVRKQFSALREVYQQVVTDTQLPGFSLHLTWKPQLVSLPQFSKSGKPGLTVETIQREENKNRTSVDDTNELTNIESQVPEVEKKQGLIETKVSKCSDSDSEKEICIPIQEDSETKEEKDDGSEQPNTVQDKEPTLREETNELVTSDDGVKQRCSEGDLKPSDLEFPSLNQNTAVWDTMDASRYPASTHTPDKLDPDALINEKNTIAMELLWIQQAIDSRKQYLRLRQQMTDGAT